MIMKGWHGSESAVVMSGKGCFGRRLVAKRVVPLACIACAKSPPRQKVTMDMFSISPDCTRLPRVARFPQRAQLPRLSEWSPATSARSVIPIVVFSEQASQGQVHECFRAQPWDTQFDPRLSSSSSRRAVSAASLLP